MLPKRFIDFGAVVIPKANTSKPFILVCKRCLLRPSSHSIKSKDFSVNWFRVPPQAL